MNYKMIAAVVLSCVQLMHANPGAWYRKSTIDQATQLSRFEDEIDNNGVAGMSDTQLTKNLISLYESFDLNDANYGCREVTKQSIEQDNQALLKKVTKLLVQHPAKCSSLCRMRFPKTTSFDMKIIKTRLHLIQLYIGTLFPVSELKQIPEALDVFHRTTFASYMTKMNRVLGLAIEKVQAYLQDNEMSSPDNICYCFDKCFDGVLAVERHRAQIQTVATYSCLENQDFQESFTQLTEKANDCKKEVQKLFVHLKAVCLASNVLQSKLRQDARCIEMINYIKPTSKLDAQVQLQALETFVELTVDDNNPITDKVADSIAFLKHCIATNTFRRMQESDRPSVIGKKIDDMHVELAQSSAEQLKDLYTQLSKLELINLDQVSNQETKEGIQFLICSLRNSIRVLEHHCAFLAQLNDTQVTQALCDKLKPEACNPPVAIRLIHLLDTEQMATVKTLILENVNKNSENQITWSSFAQQFHMKHTMSYPDMPVSSLLPLTAKGTAATVHTTQTESPTPEKTRMLTAPRIALGLLGAGIGAYALRNTPAVKAVRKKLHTLLPHVFADPGTENAVTEQPVAAHAA